MVMDVLRATLDNQRDATEQLLAGMLHIESISGHESELVMFLAQWARRHGFETDVFELPESQLQGYAQANLRHIPLAGRPTLVIRLAGQGTGKSLMFNGHSDVISPGDTAQWRDDPWSGHAADGRMYGRGACDVKGPLASALAALLAVKQSFPAGLPGDVMVEIVPGEEDCVGLGTLTSHVRGYHPSGLIVLEPTEGRPRLASRGGLRFTIRLRGKAVHGTVKWLGQDAILGIRETLAQLEHLETLLSAVEQNPLFAAYRIQRPITVDRVEAANWQGATCDSALCQGYLELLPGDNIKAWKNRFCDQLSEMHQKGRGRGCAMEIDFSEEYGGHEISPGHELALVSQQAMASAGLAPEKDTWSGFNAGCEAGLRWGLDRTPTLVWGPGSLAQAHGVDEFVELSAVHQTALAFALCTIHWTALTVD
jgi:acetylornithine deacetylase